jgi:hypothetical protein
MDKSILLETAAHLKQVSVASADEYQKKAEQLVHKMNTLMYERVDIEDLVGKNNLNMMKDNHANHARFMVSVCRNYNPEVLVETVLWVFRAYRSRGFTTGYWAAQLNTWMTLLHDELSADSYREIVTVYEWIQINIPVFVKLSDEKLDASLSLHY